MVELADALASGASGSNLVRVQVPPSAPKDQTLSGYFMVNRQGFLFLRTPDINAIMMSYRWDKPGKTGFRMIIRDVKLEDAERLVEIYSHYVLNTAVSFEYEVPSVEEFRQRIEKITAKFPYLVCEKDGKIVGYVYAGEYSSRSAYSWTAAMSIYVDKDYRRQGIGTILYKEIEPRLKEMGIVNLLAGTAYCEPEDEYLTHASSCFHMHQGYYEVAHMKKIGKKFDRWYDLKWFEKEI